MRRTSRTLCAFLFGLPLLLAQPDVIVGAVTGMNAYGSDGTYSAFSVGTTSCNIGNQDLPWISNTNQHPLIAQNLYRLLNGRFVQVGYSWVKHGIGVAPGSLCSPCQAPASTYLGVGCSDPYSQNLNGVQNILGPRSPVNASTGYFPYPFTAPAYSGFVARRLRVRDADLVPGATWIAEGHYIHPVDALAGQDDNNASHRLANLNLGTLAFSMTGATFQQQPAILGWAALDPSVTVQEVQVPGQDGGRVILASKVTGGPGAWHYEYALYNMNCHDSVGALSISFPTGTAISGAGFYAPESHSGEPYDNNPWVPAIASNGIVFSVDQPYYLNPNSNALRWGTLYSFWFDASDSPTGAAIGLYRSNCLLTIGGPSCITPPWQVNQAGSSFDVDGLTNGPTTGPIVANLGVNELHFVNVSGTSGQPFQWFATLAPGSANVFSTPGGQTVNLDFTHPTFAALWADPLPAMPPGGFAFPLLTPNGIIDLSIQQIVLDAASPDGFWLSALNEIHIAPCMPNVETLTLTDNSTVGISVGAGSNHPCLNPITFAGTTYGSFFVNSNGSVSFASGSNDSSATASEFSNNMPRLAGLWTNLNPALNGTITVTSTPTGLLTVSFQNVAQYANAGIQNSFDLVFDTANGSCAIQGYSPGPVTDHTLVGLSPGGGAPLMNLSWSTLAGQGPQTASANVALYEYTTASAPTGFTSITFPTADAGTFIVN